MFLGCHYFDPDTDEWIPTGDSIHAENIDRLHVKEDGDTFSCYTVMRTFTEALPAMHVLFSKAPDLDSLYAIMGVMLDQSGLGRWPRPTQQVLHGEEPGVN